MAATLHFAKYEGLGNDFVIVDGRSQDLARAAEHAVAICDRHRGVGADGVLLVDFPSGTGGGSVARMRVINADGSRPEMCGNGLRCVAQYLRDSGLARADDELVIETDAGPHRARVRGELVQVEMRPASLDPASIPVAATAPVLDQPFDVDGTAVRFTCVSMGNPHAVTFDDIGAAARAALGPRFGTHARFPNGANIGFARVIGPEHIELAVWERGAGFTQACGTGACAAAVAAVETGRAVRGRPIDVQLPGGPLRIVVGEPGKPIQMTGPARAVFRGEYRFSD